MSNSILTQTVIAGTTVRLFVRLDVVKIVRNLFHTIGARADELVSGRIERKQDRRVLRTIV